MANKFRYANIIALSAASIALVGSIFFNGSKFSAIESQIRNMNESARARREIQGFFAMNEIPYAKSFCSRYNSGGAEGICKILVVKNFDRLSNNTDLWVALDGISVFADLPQLPKSLRREITRYYIDLTTALDVDGAWSSVLRSDDFTGVVSTNKLYEAIIAQAVVCQTMPGYRNCRDGMTMETRKALSSLAGLVLRDGPGMAPYEMSNRINSLNYLYSSGIIDRQT